MVLTGLPSQNVLYMLLTVGELKRVEGRLKLFKLQHLLQTEAKMKFDKPDVENERGYTDYGTLAECVENHLITQSVSLTGFGNARYDYELSETGTQLYGIIKPEIPQKDMTKIVKVLEKYGSKDGHALMEYTHQKYIDQFKASDIPQLCKMQLESITKIQNITKQLMQTTQDPETYVILGRLEHIKNIVKQLPSKSSNKIQAGTLFCSIKELEDCLTASAYKPNDAAEDVFSFIENYAAKEGILGSMDSVDLSSLPREDQECLSTFLNQLKQH